MRPLLLATALFLAAAPHAQTARLGADLLLGTTSAGFVGGGAVTGLVHGRGALAPYAAIRPALTVATVGGEGFEAGTTPFDGIANNFTCRSVQTGAEAPDGSCGSYVPALAVGTEAGARVGLGRGALLVGGGYRAGADRGAFGAVTAQFAAPFTLRLEAGAGHALVGFGFGRF